MKSRFTTLDLVCELVELRRRLLGMRVNQVYDVDSRTYLLRLQRPGGDGDDHKAVLLVESGARIHATQFEWPKSPAPSGFAMKLRKHLNNKRLESADQLGADRVVDLRFGAGDAAHHLILELYDRGNLVLTDCDYKILNILRPRVQGEDKFLVRETYPVELAREHSPEMTAERLREIFSAVSKPGETVKKVCSSHFEYGPPFLEHLLLTEGVRPAAKIGKDFVLDDEMMTEKLLRVFNGAENFVRENEPKGFIVQKSEMRPNAEGQQREFLSYAEFHPYLFEQHRDRPKVELESFDAAVDEFYSKVESQKIELKAVQQERQAMKKLDNVRRDHEERLGKLRTEQQADRRKAELIELNEAMVDAALTVMRSAIANQVDWKEIGELVKEAAESGDLVASRIKALKLETNHFSMLLSDPYSHLDADDSEEEVEEREAKEMLVDIDLDLSAQANARSYYTQRKSAVVKEQKTLDSHSVAMKSAEKKTKQTLKEVAAITNINKARKVFWFEKFFWFVSSENYLVVAGRDAQQNELLVKRYLRPGDVYVHADLHGASSVVIKNPTQEPVPPKTLNEAGQMAVCYSAAWESKVVSSAWWVDASQVSKTAPSGEYLTVGSFMVRGKKNFLPPATLVLGFGFLFRLEEGSVERHRGERKVRDANDDLASLAGSEATGTAEDASDALTDELGEMDVAVEEGESSSDEQVLKEDEDGKHLDDIKEEEDEAGINFESKENANDDKEQNDTKEDQDDKDDSEEREEEEEEEKSAFPDTFIDIDYTKQGEATVKARGLSESSDRREEEDVITFVQNPQRKKRQQQQQGRQKRQQQEQQQQQQQQLDKGSEDDKTESADGGRGHQQKRGKRGKMKKIREKYKDQDEEERELRMKILQGSQKEKQKKERKKEAEGGKRGGGGGPKQKQQQQRQQQQQQQHHQHARREQEEDEDDEKAAAAFSSEVDMLDSLTGVPVSEDELLFAVPVVAPYNVMNPYKFKVKLTPGTGKRGKATKTALAMFLADRSVQQREKDLLRAVKDQDLARNLPGKVKLSAPHLQKIKSKAKGGKKK